MPEILTEVEGDSDADSYQLRPFGLLFMRLGNEALARKACDGLADHMRRFKRSVYVDDDGLHFGNGLDDDDYAIVTRAILWHDFTGEHKERAERELVEAIEAARCKVWAQRRE